MEIGLLRNSALTPYIFNLALDARCIQNIIPNCIFFVDDIILFSNLILDIQKTIPNCMLLYMM